MARIEVSRIKRTEHSTFVLSKPGQNFTIESGELFGLIYDLFVETNCDTILISALEAAKDTCKKR
jgi:hypothetical protein